MFKGNESLALKSLPAVVVLPYFTASEKENLPTERKQNYVITKRKKKKENSDYYHLSNRKMIDVVFFSLVSLLAFHSSEKVLSAQVCSLACVSITVLLLKTRSKAGSAKVNISGRVKKVTVTTNNRKQARFNSARRKKAKH